MFKQPALGVFQAVLERNGGAVTTVCHLVKMLFLGRLREKKDSDAQ